MLLVTLFGPLEIVSTNNNIKRGRNTNKTPRELITKTLSKSKFAKNLVKPTKTSSLFTQMPPKRMDFIKKFLFFGTLFSFGLYATSIFVNSLTRDVIHIRSYNEDCTIRSNEIGFRRLRREVNPSEISDNHMETNHHDPPHCLDETDALFYVSAYHRKVCDSMVKLAFEIFYERDPSESEFMNWFDKCVSREVNEAYMTWKFTENEEHLDLLRTKRGAKEESDSGDAHQDDDEPVVVPMQLRIPNQEFTDDLSDPESEEFQQMSKEYSDALAEVLGDEVPGLTGVKILGFGNGSLIVFYELIFDKEVKTVEMVYENEDEREFLEASTAFDPVEFAEKVKDKVKDVIKEALSNSEDRKGKLNNTILADADVDLESLETIPEDVVQDLIKLNPAAPIVSVDLTTHHHNEVEKIQPDVEENTRDKEIEVANVQDDDVNNDVIDVTSRPTVTTTAVVGVTQSTTTMKKQNTVVITEATTTEDPTTTQPVTTTTLQSITQESSSGNEPDSPENSDDNINNPIYYGLYPMNNHNDDTESSNDVKNIDATTITTMSPNHDVITTNNDVILDSAEAPTTTNATEKTPEIVMIEANPLPHVNISELSQTVFVKLRVTNMNYTKNLTDRQSEEFQVLEAKFVQILQPLLQSIDGFSEMEVVGFSYGSLIVNNEIHFKDHAPDNIKEDVKERIAAAAGYFKYAHVTVDADAVEVLRPDEADICEFVQCHLYADCVLKTSYRTECVCRPGYVSVDPANCVSICDLEPGYCRNGGECNVVPGRGAVCRCRVNYNWGYNGERCENLMPKSVLLVSASTGAACVVVMLLLVVAAYCFHRKRRKTRAERKAKALADKDFMRAAQVMSYHKISRDPERLRRVNPMFVQEDDTASSSASNKDISSSTCPSPNTSSSSLNKSSNGSTSTSSFFVRERLDLNGPLPSGMNSPEQRMLHIQTGSYPNHRSTWRGDEERKNTQSSSKRSTEDISL